ncbi:hypothetical protein [Singulisphaera acidiphila]|uniref:Uncharacterized protein n=1 Tax=Singulisphaera acidiphila (strain ATCC BAA-1392 / DSM 18658 / VKM B-2454 / MOB10) TaxID=886293 RepID=L0DIE7_SINAD|nr:hypothetical protein [Singulisphaera acidiphila]AGA28406.1 hypothetical protein Sinac_4202 [Singulisphaera acidiphila DSM 18658]
MSDELDFLDGLEPDPPPSLGRAVPTPTPYPVAPAVVPVKSHDALKFGAILVFCAVCSLGSGLLFAWLLSERGDRPSPGGYDPRFVAVGKAYLGDLGSAYGLAWEDGAKILDAGQTIDMALDTTAKAWEANRKAAFNARITPELSKVVAQGKDAASVTSDDRAALAKAYRGLAKGLGGGR